MNKNQIIFWKCTFMINRNWFVMFLWLKTMLVQWYKKGTRFTKSALRTSTFVWIMNIHASASMFTRIIVTLVDLCLTVTSCITFIAFACIIRHIIFTSTISTVYTCTIIDIFSTRDAFISYKTKYVILKKILKRWSSNIFILYLIILFTLSD